MYPGQRARFAPPLQMYKDYPTAPNPMYRPPRPAQMSPGYYSPMHDPSGPQLSQCNQDSHTPQRDSSEKQGNHKSDQKTKATEDGNGSCSESKYRNHPISKTPFTASFGTKPEASFSHYT
uniref:uncharacterized protein LOC120334187 isoform X3 n=1 Tax=Styela clava TaxID=7725 RepID=UPI001939FDF5|nr:uncharacterized protein LOC120334187 isoform X3 [Styela clava]